MKSKRILITLSLLGSFTVFSQQIGDGFASHINNFNSPLPSGFYNGVNVPGAVPEVAEWGHLINLRHSNTENINQIQIGAAHNESDRMFFRKFARDKYSTAIAPTWHEIATRGTNTFVGNQVIDGIIKAGAISLNNYNSIASTNGFINKIEFTDSPHAAIVFKPGSDQELMFGFHENGNFYWGTRQSSINANKYSMYLNGSNGTLGVSGNIIASKSIGIGEPAYSNLETNGLAIGDGDTGFKQQGDGELAVFTNNNEVARFKPNGNVGIGTTNPQNKLSVDGTIWAKAVKVSLTDAADWVFDKNYKLRPLAEVEKYINQNKHLPEIPSAEEFRQNDLNVSEITNKLLQKIEELTLYAIEQNKKISKQESEITYLNTVLTQYKEVIKRVEALESKK